MVWLPRLARDSDIPALEILIPLSVHALQASCYSTAQREAAMGPVFGVDRQIIRDGTYYVIEDEGMIAACGGWSRRASLFGGDAVRDGEDALLDPACDPARVRAFFVHPAWARRGMGGSILAACENAIRAAGFSAIELVATLAGEPLYTKAGYAITARCEIPLGGGLNLPCIKMSRHLF